MVVMLWGGDCTGSRTSSSSFSPIPEGLGGGGGGFEEDGQLSSSPLPSLGAATLGGCGPSAGGVGVGDISNDSSMMMINPEEMETYDVRVAMIGKWDRLAEGWKGHRSSGSWGCGNEIIKKGEYNTCGVDGWVSVRRCEVGNPQLLLV